MELKFKLFPNQYKTNSEADKKKPDYTATFEHNYEKQQVAAWKQDDGSISIVIKPKENR